MDPISQAAAGAALAQTKTPIQFLKEAAVIGALAGMAPDLDVLIRSSQDPLLELEFHRHFTHSLFFIPIGAFLCAVFAYALLRKHWQVTFKQAYLWSFLGYASHGLLDGCTTYGTQLLWPFSDTRIAWNTISVIDPLFTIPLIVCVIAAVVRRSRSWQLAGLAWAASYLLLGWLQSERAEKLGYQLADQRGHTPVTLEAKPSFANIMVWKIVYEYEGRYFVDAVRPGLRQSTTWKGDSIAKLNIERDFPWLIDQKHSQQATDIERFRHFSSGYIGVDSRDPNSIIDIRYSMLPHQIKGLWGIRLNPDASPDSHIEYFVAREDTGDALNELLAMIFR